MQALQLLADMYDMPADPRVVALLNQASRDDDAQVRFQALLTTAELGGATADRSTHLRLIARATDDADPGIACQAWIFGGLMDRSGCAM